MTSELTNPDAQMPPQVLQEFLYADIDRARSIMSQLIGGVPEEDKVSEGLGRRFDAGLKTYLRFSKESKGEEQVQRSLLDALIPGLEETLLTEGWLTDIQDHLADESLTQEDLEKMVPPGALVKFSAPGQLFDARYLAEVFGGTSVIASAAHFFAEKARSQSISKGKTSRPKSPRPNHDAPGNLEDAVEDIPTGAFGPIGSDDLKGLIRIARGTFGAGLHLLLTARPNRPWSITTRLQEGKRYLDVERDVLFSRYGLQRQNWTIFGTIGRYAPKSVAAPDGNFFDDGKLNRDEFVAQVNQLLGHLAGQGLSDSPKYPGFSLVPIAVYRSIPPAASYPHVEVST
ncbi:DUF6414 family protein [Amycolatopsis thermoflava]|uniref:DUF6414 family protein n=1 Tax=Amycolatopsis thermoflava TaxID=84480 RepID=UPI003663373C